MGLEAASAEPLNGILEGVADDLTHRALVDDLALAGEAVGVAPRYEVRV